MALRSFGVRVDGAMAWRVKSARGEVDEAIVVRKGKGRESELLRPWQQESTRRSNLKQYGDGRECQTHRFVAVNRSFS